MSPTVFMPPICSSERAMPKSLSILARSVNTPRESHAGISSRRVFVPTLTFVSSKTLATQSNASDCTIPHNSHHRKSSDQLFGVDAPSWLTLSLSMYCRSLPVPELPSDPVPAVPIPRIAPHHSREASVAMRGLPDAPIPLQSESKEWKHPPYFQIPG